MNTRSWIAVPFVLTVASCAHLDSQQASAQPAGVSSGSDDRGALSASFIPYTWHDGTREQRVWLNPSVIAEVGQGTPEGRALPRASALAETKAGRQAIRYWQVERGSTSIEVLDQVKRERVPGRFSPVWHDTPSPDGLIRVLPGNIVVILDEGWSKARVAEWIARHRLRVLSELPFGLNMLLVETDAGLPALDLANSLYRSGEVKAAFPDWLAQKTLK